MLRRDLLAGLLASAWDHFWPLPNGVIMDVDFAQCASIVLQFEGGYSDDRNDAGNWTGGRVGRGELKGTKYGIAAAWHPDVDIRALTVYGAADIYRSGYWTPAGCSSASRGLDLCAFNESVNSGPEHARDWIARCNGNIDAFTQLSLAYHRSLKTWRLYGPGWTRRIEICRGYAHEMANHVGLGSAPPALPVIPYNAPRLYGPQAKFQSVAMWPRIMDWLGR